MAKKTIKLKSYNDVINEYEAASTITPGMLIELTDNELVRAHNRSGRNVFPMFATEDDLQGDDIDDNYSDGDKVQCWIPTRGDEVFAILADGEDVSIGDFLDSNGDGYLKKHVDEMETWGESEAGQVNVYPLQTLAIALEAKDLSGSSGEESSGTTGYNKRFKIRIV